MLEDAEVVQEGTFLYDKTVICDIRILKHNGRYGAGDSENEPEVRDDAVGEFFYIQYGSPTARGVFLSESQALPSLEAAIQEAEQVTNGTARWKSVVSPRDAVSRRSLTKMAKIVGLFFSPDGTKLFNSQMRKVIVWNVDTCSLCCVCPGSLIGISHNGEICLTYRTSRGTSAWDLTTGAELVLRRLDPESFPYHQRIIVSLSHGNALLVQDVFKGTQLQLPKRISLSSIPQYDAKSPWKIPNNRYVLVRNFHDAGHFEGYTLGCVDVESGKMIFSIDGDPNYRYRLFFSSEHNTLVVDKGSRIEFYDAFSGNNISGIERLIADSLPYRMVDGKKVFHDTLTDKPIKRPTAPTRSISLDPKNRLRVAIAAGEEIELVDMSSLFDKTVTMREQRSGKTEKRIREVSAINEIAFHPDSRRIACVLQRGVTRMWDTATDEIVCEFDRS